MNNRFFTYKIFVITTIISLNIAIPSYVEADMLLQRGRNATVNIELKNAEIQDVLKLLAKKHGLNIITSPDVVGTISVSLKGVKIRHALDSIIKMNGYDWFQENNIIMVKPANTEIRGDKVTKVFKLNYIDADKVKESLVGVVSSRSEITTFGLAVKGGETQKTGASNIIIVTDVPQNIPNITAVIDALDVPVPQITIEVQFVETRLSENEDFGINWNATATFGGGPSSGTSTVTGVASQQTGFPILGTFKGFNIATLSLQQFKIVMDALMTEGRSKLLNNPTLSTLDNQEAFTEIKTTIPVAVPQTQTGSSVTGGLTLTQALTFEDKDISISLKIIPHVTENDYVMLAITTSVAAITGFTGPNNDRPITSERKADTKIMVRAGDTAAIGGLIKEDEFISYKKVPYLSSIPLIGKLFVHKSLEKSKDELIIFITPHIQYFHDLTAN
ncbi:MAG: hypothetical protein IIB39_10205 [Candidatus Marinimicrobia bacterium]|nr:hypothetical protein [Candidatus Neomarinimicrobiota bacterium]